MPVKIHIHDSIRNAMDVHNKYKKSIIIILIVVITVFFLAGCIADNKSDEEPGTFSNDRILKGIQEWYDANHSREDADLDSIVNFDFPNDYELISDFKYLVLGDKSVVGYFSFKEDIMCMDNTKEEISDYLDEIVSTVSKELDLQYDIDMSNDHAFFFISDDLPLLLGYYNQCVSGEFINR